MNKIEYARIWIALIGYLSVNFLSAHNSNFPTGHLSDVFIGETYPEFLKDVGYYYNLKPDSVEIDALAKDAKYSHVLQGIYQKNRPLVNKDRDTSLKAPVGLIVEFIRLPEQVRIIDSKPEFGWVVPQKAVFQSAYQILIASSKENMDNNIGDIWDSKQVRGNASSEIEHKGASLQERSTYYWKVRIWDGDNRLSGYSKSQTFTMGSLDKTITTPNIFQIDSIKPSSFEKRGATSYFMDFGKDAFATIDFTYNAKSEHILTFRIGEQLQGKKINRNPQGHIRYQEIQVSVKPEKKNYRLLIKVDERNTQPNKAVALPDSFPVLMPFRYAEVENVQAPVTTNDFTQLAYHSYWEDDQSSFKSSDDILNQVWELCKYSIKATTFAGLYVDGDRERIPYEADAYLNQLSHYTTDREYAIARQTIEYFMEHPTWPTEWQLHVALMFHADYMYTGNIELIEKYYDGLKHKTLMELAREDGLITSTKASPEFMKKLGFRDPKAKLRDITDWPPADKDTGWDLAMEEGERDGFVFMPYNTVINSFYYKNMEIMAEFAEVLGKTGEAMEFKLLALSVKKAINEKMFDKKTGAYVDGEGTAHSSIHANMMALAFNIVPKERIPSVVEFIKSRGMACSVYGAQYLMEALYNAGEDDYALELMTSKKERSWYNMIRVGSTITLEAWGMKHKPNSDWNHAWGAVPANIIPRGLWGIRPKTPGYGIATINPQMGTLNSSSIEVPTLKGKIKGDYKFVNDRLQVYTIEIPANMVAEFEVTSVPNGMVKLNGEKVSTSFGSVRLTPGINHIEFTVGSF